MSVCEKCWRDAGGSMDRYVELLRERAAHPCTPEQQAGQQGVAEAPSDGELAEREAFDSLAGEAS